jgi:DnaJ-class molecular chaperone
MVTHNYYKTLLVHGSASSSMIKSQYRKLSFQFHPDQGGTTEQMVTINEAYRVLSNGLLRREYDQKLLRMKQLVKSDDSQARRSTTAVSDLDDYYNQTFSESHLKKQYFWRWFSVIALATTAILVFEIGPTFVRETPSAAIMKKPPSTQR